MELTGSSGDFKLIYDPFAGGRLWTLRNRRSGNAFSRKRNTTVLPIVQTAGKVPEVSPPGPFRCPPRSRKRPWPMEGLRERRSIRDYSSTPLSLQDLSNLLWATQGITEKALAPWYRTAPSAGALHPIDTYLVVNRVEGMEPGIYFFEVIEFSLT